MCTTSILYPLNFSVYNITTIIDGLIYYKQGSQLTKLQIGMVILGVILLLIGVAGLSWKLTIDKEDVGLQVTIPGVYDVPPDSTWLTPKSPRDMSQDEANEIWGVLADQQRPTSRAGRGANELQMRQDNERTSLLRPRRTSSPPPSRFQSFRQVLGRYSFMRSKDKNDSDA